MSLNSSTLALTLLFAGTLACAQEREPVPAKVDLATLLNIVRERSPRLALERQTIAIAETNRIGASAYPNPTLNYGYTRQGGGQATLFTGRRQDQVNVDVPLLVAGQRGARVEKAEREVEAARARVAAGASSLAAEAGVAFVSLLAAQEKAAVQASATEELVRLRHIVAGRAELGMASRYDLTRIEVELATARTKLDDARADVADQSGSLAALLGVRDWRPQAIGSLLPLSVNNGGSKANHERARTSPAALSAISEEKVAQSAVDLAQRERWPVPSISVGRTWTSDPFGAANFLGLSVEILLLDKRRGPVARAEAEAIAASTRRELVVDETTATLDRYSQVIAARQAALQRFEADAVTRLPALKDMAEDAYRLGRGSIFELLDSTRSRFELQQTRVELLAGLVEAQLRYLATSGDLERAVERVTKP
jgi:cobalt-zinc-cadmium efflux system outer membrane protein